MKKILSILLAAFLIAAILPTAAFADGPAIVLSSQGLRVNGKTVDCERYNIDGNNYFQLRDLAYVLNGTGSQFSVGYDSAAKSVSLTTGEGYASLGTEMQMSDFDKIDTAAPSNDKLVINGEDRSDLSAYKIGGHNYYKLAELGPALGFQVTYDTPSRTMIIVTKAYSVPTEWLTVETIYNEDGAATSHQVDTYDEEGHQLSNLWEGEDGNYLKETYTYDELGRQIFSTYDCVSTYGSEVYEEHSTTTFTYDDWGLLAKSVYEAMGDVTSETTYTYDENGNLLVTEYLGNAGRTAYYYTYDEFGNELTMAVTSDDEVLYSLENEWDAEGNLLCTVNRDADGAVSGTTEYVYVDGRMTESVNTYGNTRNTTRYYYDEWGNTSRYEWENDYGTSYESLIYDAEGHLLQDEFVSDTHSSVTVYTYNEMGLRTKVDFSDSNGEYSEETYTYAADGSPLSYVYRSEGSAHTITYSYDPAAHKVTVLNMTEYFGVG